MTIEFNEHGMAYVLIKDGEIHKSLPDISGHLMIDYGAEGEILGIEVSQRPMFKEQH